MLTLHRRSQLLLALCLRLFFCEQRRCMYWDTSCAQEFSQRKLSLDPPCEEVFRPLGSAGGARDVRMLTLERRSQLLLALCLRLFFCDGGKCMYQDTSHAQILFGGESHCAPPATKFLDLWAAQGARVAILCLLWSADHNCSSLYA